jgi:hypothetical protein
MAIVSVNGGGSISNGDAADDPGRPTGEDSKGLWQINLATDQSPDSKVFGQPVTFTATIHSPGFTGGVLVASGDVNASQSEQFAIATDHDGVIDGTSNTLMLAEHPPGTAWSAIVDVSSGDPVGNADAGGYLLYQDVVIPYGDTRYIPSADQSNGYLLTSIEHAATDPLDVPERDDEALVTFAHGDSPAGCSPWLCGDNGPLIGGLAAHAAISLADGSLVEGTSVPPQDLLLS